MATRAEKILCRNRQLKSAFRWTTSIIYKLMMTVWDIWNFRNSLIHGTGGVNQRATNKELNEEIRIQFNIGLQNLLEKDQYLKKDYTLSKLLHESSIDDKRSWIRAVQAARRAVENNEINEGSQHFQQPITDYLTRFSTISTTNRRLHGQ